MDKITICFRYDTAVFHLHYPTALYEHEQSKLRRLFKLMLTDCFSRNDEAIRVTSEYLAALVIESKEAWAKASADFQNEWVDVDYFARSLPAAPKGKKQERKSRIAKVKQKNAALLSAVKRTKAEHQRMVKLNAAFVEMKEKYSY